MFATKEEVIYARKVLGMANALHEIHQQFSESPQQRSDCRDVIAQIIVDFEKSQTDPDPNFSIVPMSAAQRVQLAELIMVRIFEL